VSDYNAVVELKEAIENDLGAVDILANNAGILALVSLREGKHTDLERIIRVNLLSQIWVSVSSQHYAHVHFSMFQFLLRPTEYSSPKWFEGDKVTY
jgi:NAD(P)-dependent dehydrogenase (short-subunit alcohol dehydrogenase family)